MNIKKIDLFNPLIIVLLIFIFVLIALPSWYITEELHTPENPMYFFILVGVIFFVIGNYFPNFLSKFSNKFKELFNITSDKNLEKLPFFGNYSNTEKILLAIVIVGILLQVINLINLGGIPLFSSALKSKAATKIWLLSYILYLPGINLLLAKFNRKGNYLFLILGLVLFSLTGYRTTPIAILLSSFITLYYTRDLNSKHYFVFGLLIFIVLVVVGFIAMKSIIGQQWRLGPFELLSYRSAFTLNIFDKITRREFLTGGYLFYSTLTGFFNSVDPRVVVGQVVMHQNQSLTSTIFGPATLDFGFWGMCLQMFFLGFVLKLMYLLQRYGKGVLTAFYGIILAQTIIWIETGPTDIVVWIFYLLSIILILFSFKNLSLED